jgi:hypothetical protein
MRPFQGGFSFGKTNFPMVSNQMSTVDFLTQVFISRPRIASPNVLCEMSYCRDAKSNCLGEDLASLDKSASKTQSVISLGLMFLYRNRFLMERLILISL